MSENTPTQDDYFQPIKLETPVNQLAWLIAHKDEICRNDEIIKCLVKNHIISEEEYENAINAYWDNEKPKSTTFPLSTFLGEESGFTKYYVFKADNSHAIAHTLAPFDFNGHNYSICFFKGLPLKFAGVNATSNLIFTEGRINGRNVIVFCIDGVAGACFDFTQNPPGKP